jgi:lysophospholipid acyltransferase (LPLAT)-like uncharacterized protein
LVSNTISFLIYYILKWLDGTFEYRFIGNENLSVLKEKGALFAIWHHTLINGILAQKERPFVVMVSRSKDANPVAYVCNKLGHVVTRGSSRKGNRDKGGGSALSEMVERVKSGHPAALTVDGPTGPAKKTKEGIILLALKTNSVIIPYASICDSYWQFNSWDKFRFPKPFARVLIGYGKPIDVSTLDMSEALIKIDNAINELEVECKDSFSKWFKLEKYNYFKKMT